MSLRLRIAAEFFGSAFLLMAVAGSGIVGERLAGGDAAIALLANSLATGAALYALIATLGPISGAHFNPAVSAALALRGDLERVALPAYLLAQCTGALAGVLAAHAMFELPLFELSTKARSGWPRAWSEFVATGGLLGVVLIGARLRPQSVPQAVAGYITAAYWFTASTAFANPALTLARAFTDTFAGISPRDVPLFLGAQGLAVAASAIATWSCRPAPRSADRRAGRPTPDPDAAARA